MRLTSELTLDAPLERAWKAVLELGGPVRVDLGGQYEGAARLDDADEDERIAGFHAQARETAGHGLAAATIAARLSEDDGATRIAVDTDLRLTGDARPQPEALQAAADELLARVAAHLERRLEGTVAELPADEPPVEHAEAERSVADLARELLDAELTGSDPSGPPAVTKSEPVALKGSDPLVVAGKVAERALLVVVGVAIGLALGRVFWRRR